MANTAAKVKIVRFTLDALRWTPIVAPLNANFCRLYDEAGTSEILRRTDPDDSSTETTQPAGMPYEVTTNPPFTSAATTSSVNFKKDEIVCWAQVPTGTVTLIAEFL